MFSKSAIAALAASCLLAGSAGLARAEDSGQAAAHSSNPNAVGATGTPMAAPAQQPMAEQPMAPKPMMQKPMHKKMAHKKAMHHKTM